MARSKRQTIVCLLTFCAALLPNQGRAQEKGEPGKFDFYLMNVAAPGDFCHVPGAGPACKAPRNFVLHGLWTQNNNGTYPVNCSGEQGPADYSRFLDLTPDLPLLQHEWEKHGTCSAVGVKRFFEMERKAYGMLRLPEDVKRPRAESTVDTEAVLKELYRINVSFPQGSILLSCKAGVLTAVEACFSKDLKPIRCEALRSCSEPKVRIVRAADAAGG